MYQNEAAARMLVDTLFHCVNHHQLGEQSMFKMSLELSVEGSSYISDSRNQRLRPASMRGCVDYTPVGWSVPQQAGSLAQRSTGIEYVKQFARRLGVMEVKGPDVIRSKPTAAFQAASRATQR